MKIVECQTREGSEIKKEVNPWQRYFITPEEAAKTGSFPFQMIDGFVTFIASIAPLDIMFHNDTSPYDDKPSYDCIIRYINGPCIECGYDQPELTTCVCQDEL